MKSEIAVTRRTTYRAEENVTNLEKAKKKQDLLIDNMNEEIKRRTRVVRIFPNEASCLRLVRALAVEVHEDWIEATRYLDMELLGEHERQRVVRSEDVA